MGKRWRVRRRAREFEGAGVLQVDPVTFEGPDHWSNRFGRQAPLELEIGFGKGEFLQAKAQSDLDRDFIGIELNRGRLLWTESKLCRAGVDNVRLVWGCALRLLPLMVADEQLSTCYLNFPDPWPKRRHASRRLLRPCLLEEVIRVLAPGGNLIIVSDVQDYARTALEILDDWSERVDNLFGRATMGDAIPGYPETIHEIKFRKEGRPIFFLHYRKL